MTTQNTTDEPGEAISEVAQCAQAVLTALNVGDIQSGSPLHLKLREVMIAYRERAARAPLAAVEGATLKCRKCGEKADVEFRYAAAASSAPAAAPSEQRPSEIASSDSERRVKLLLRYVDHLRGCASYTNGACTCGFESAMRGLAEPLQSESNPWCEFCQLSHPVPKDAAHKAALGCKGVWFFADVATTSPETPVVPAAGDDEGEKYRSRAAWLREGLLAARDALVSVQHLAGQLPYQDGYSATMTPAELQLSKIISQIDKLLLKDEELAGLRSGEGEGK